LKINVSVDGSLVINMSDNNTYNPGNRIGALSKQAEEAQKGIRRIISIWRKLASDPDPSIRVLALIATVIGALSLICLIIFYLHTAISHFSDKVDPPSFKFVMVILGFWGSSYIGVGAKVALRYSNRAQTNVLAAGFERIYEQKYGSREFMNRDRGLQ
jgi:hypothetical protein